MILALDINTGIQTYLLTYFGRLCLFCNIVYWLIQVSLIVSPVSVCLSVRLFVCLSDVCKHEFCKNALSGFSVT